MPHVLFLAHNRRGLGHLMRGQNIARALRSLAPQVEIQFFARSDSAATLCGSEFACVVDASDTWRDGWADCVERLAPDVVVYDTLLPDQAPPPARASVYVMRRCKEDRQAAIFASPFLETVDRVIIPHTPEEFGYALPETLAGRSRFVGPIVRPLDARTQADLRARYALRDGETLVVSTPGGGGFTEDVTSFFGVVAEAHCHLLAAQPSARHIVVRGPNYVGPIPSLPGMTVVEHEPELGNLFALASLVVAEGGYNTVQELRLARVPAVFLPGDRSYDDQEERVRALESQGAAAVFTDRDPALVAPAIAAIAGDLRRLAAMRESYGALMPNGDRAAAAAIGELLGAL